MQLIILFRRTENWLTHKWLWSIIRAIVQLEPASKRMIPNYRQHFSFWLRLVLNFPFCIQTMSTASLPKIQPMNKFRPLALKISVWTATFSSRSQCACSLNTPINVYLFTFGFGLDNVSVSRTGSQQMMLLTFSLLWFLQTLNKACQWGIWGSCSQYCLHEKVQQNCNREHSDDFLLIRFTFVHFPKMLDISSLDQASVNTQHRLFHTIQYSYDSIALSDWKKTVPVFNST